MNTVVNIVVFNSRIWPTVGTVNNDYPHLSLSHPLRDFSFDVFNDLACYLCTRYTFHTFIVYTTLHNIHASIHDIQASVNRAYIDYMHIGLRCPVIVNIGSRTISPRQYSPDNITLNSIPPATYPASISVKGALFSSIQLIFCENFLH